MNINDYFLDVKRFPDQALIGVTGGIGSGKTSVVETIAEAGYATLSADDIARDITAQSEEAKAAIRQAFGEEVFQLDGSLNRETLAALIFGEGETQRRNRETLNAIVHPAVWREVAARARALFSEGRRFVFNESALLFETGADALYDLTVTVDAPEETRILRLSEGRGIAPDEARRRIQAQMPAEEKKRRAGYVIYNHGSRLQMREETMRFLETLERTIFPKGLAVSKKSSETMKNGN